MRVFQRLAFLAALLAIVSRPVSAVEVLGTGADFLFGSDLTDVDDDGIETAYFPPDDLGGYDAIFFSSDEPGFEGGEFAFNVFDNQLSPGNGKWCCGTQFPQIVGADFTETTGEAYRLTHFTVASANDVPARDPVEWTIEGRTEAGCWVEIFTPDDLLNAADQLGVVEGQPLWNERFQVILFEEGVDYDDQEEAYTAFRMVTYSTQLTTGAFFQIGEIEFFGDPADPLEDPAQCTVCETSIQNLDCSLDDDGLTLTWENDEELCPDCLDEPTLILFDGIEVAQVDNTATSAMIDAGDLPEEAFTITVENCSGISRGCSITLTTGTGQLNASAWLALGPFLDADRLRRR